MIKNAYPEPGVDRSIPYGGITRRRFASHPLGKLVVSLLLFAVLVVVGDRTIGEYWRDFTRGANVKALGETPSALRDAWRIGVVANLFGCLSSFCVVYSLRGVRFAPITELLGAMVCRTGVPALCCLQYLPRSGLTEFQAVFREWAFFYIVLVYLLTLPLDVWLVLPRKVSKRKVNE